MAESKVSKPIRISMTAYQKAEKLAKRCLKSPDEALKTIAESGDTAFYTMLINRGMKSLMDEGIEVE